MRKPAYQHTLKDKIEFAGIGLHSGEECRIALHPAPAHAGIVFHRRDLAGHGRDIEISASPLNVVNADHGTTLANSEGVSIATVEHLMAALALTGVDNVTVEATGPEIPILDGSAAAFVAAIAETGLITLEAEQAVFKVGSPRRYDGGAGRSIAFEPFDGRRIEVEIDFGECLIGRQQLALDLDNPVDIARLSAARTFCRLHEVEALRGAGLIRGGALSNGLVVDGDRLLNDEPLRDPAEFALHKALDLIGDFYLLGAPVIGLIRAVKPGHAVNTRAARALMQADAGAELPPRAAPPARARA